VDSFVEGSTNMVLDTAAFAGYSYLFGSSFELQFVDLFG